MAFPFVLSFCVDKYTQKKSAETIDDEWQEFGYTDLRNDGYELLRAIRDTSKWLSVEFAFQNEKRELIGTWLSKSRSYSRIIANDQMFEIFLQTSGVLGNVYGGKVGGQLKNSIVFKRTKSNEVIAETNCWEIPLSKKLFVGDVVYTIKQNLLSNDLLIESPDKQIVAITKLAVGGGKSLALIKSDLSFELKLFILHLSILT
jgi:hypothetical protein